MSDSSPVQFMKDMVEKGNEYIWFTPEEFPWLVALLLGTGIFITFRMGWINFRCFKHAVLIVLGRYDDPNDEGDINHFQALATALSATVGIGNIAGVAIGIHCGGPGILFWLWISGLFGMTLKFAECTLSLHYRNFDEKGNASGGPMYYIDKGLGPSFKWMAILFACLAVICSFGTGNMNQANTVAKSAQTAFGIDTWTTGIVLAVLVALVILGGIKRIGLVSSRLMPCMAVIYALGGLAILVLHIDELPASVQTIVNSAFTPEASFGGAALGAWNLTLLWGIKRALFSNEAGQGSAPIAHAAARTKEPVREGLVALLGPFVDTLCICTITGLVIVVTGVWDAKEVTIRDLEAKEIDIHYLPEVLPEESMASHKSLERWTYLQIQADEEGEDEGIEPVLRKIEESFTVTEGMVEGAIFVFNHGLIQNPRILDGEGKPFSGTLDKEFQVVDPETGRSEILQVEGGMLQTGAVLTAWAFQQGFEDVGLGMLGFYIVHLSVFLFGLSTIISWSYYGDRCVEYLFGVRYVIVYRLCYVCFTCLGSILALQVVWDYGDLAMGLMTVPNLVAVLLLSPVVAKLTRDYLQRLRQQKEASEV